MTRRVRYFEDLHPIVQSLVNYFSIDTSRGHPLYRITSIVRENSDIHRRGHALDIAPMMYSPNCCSAYGARTLARHLERKGFHPLMVVGEDDHYHIQPHLYQAYGYSGADGVVVPTSVKE